MKVLEKEIIEGCVKKNKAAQEKFFKNYWGFCCGVARRYVGIHDYKDVAQDALLKMFDLLDSSKGGSLEGWVKKVVISTSIDFLRKKKEIISFSSIGEGDEMIAAFIHNKSPEIYILNPEEEKEYDKAIRYKTITSELYRLIDNLSPQYKIIFNLYVFDGLTHEEISEYLKISKIAVRVNLFRARQKIRKNFNRKLN